MEKHKNTKTHKEAAWRTYSKTQKEQYQVPHKFVISMIRIKNYIFACTTSSIILGDVTACMYDNCTKQTANYSEPHQPYLEQIIHCAIGNSFQICSYRHCQLLYVVNKRPQTEMCDN
jgi:hypothetical protein